MSSVQSTDTNQIMAPKVERLRCIKREPGQIDIYKHGDDLATCQEEIKADGRPYSLQQLWPLFKGSQNADNSSQNEAREFLEQVIESARNGVTQPWSKETMEEAAKLAFPPKLASAMSSLSIASSGTPASVDPTTTTSSGPTQPANIAPLSATQSMAATTAASGAVQTTIAQPPTGTVSTTAISAVTAPSTTAPAFVALGPTPLADPSGPHFMTQQVQNTNQAAVHHYIQGLAGRLADAEHDNQQRLNGVPVDSRTQLNNQQRDSMKPSIVQKFGLRTGFATPDPGALVETNFLSMTFPQRIYVYDVEMIRARDNQGNPILVKKQWDQLEILHIITFAPTPFPQYTTALHTNRASWVSDGSLIWSTVALFAAGQPRQVPGPLASTPTQVIGYDNETGHSLTIDHVNVIFRQEFDLTRSVGELFFDTTAATFRDSSPSILTRGLNAFFTRYVRDRSDPIPPGNTSSFVRVGLNRSFRTGAGASSTELDGTNAPEQTIQAVSGFSLSVRPGVHTVYVNISNSTSPFFKRISVQQFIQRCTSISQGRSVDEVVNALKGIKVRITYKTNQTQTTFPLPTSRFRFITGVVGSADHAPTRPVMYPQVRNAGQWYATNSPYQGRANYPNPVVQQFKGLCYVNVGKSPAVSRDNVEWYPATALEIVSFQPFPGRLMRDQTARMITAALKTPTNHKNTILGSQVGGGLHHFAFSGAFAGTQQGGLMVPGMSAGTQFTQIPGRWLAAPSIEYSAPRDHRDSSQDFERATTSNSVQPKTASWDLRNSAFVSTATIDKIPVLNLSTTRLPHPGFRTNLRKQLRKHGLIRNLQITVDVRDISINQPEFSPQWEQAFVEHLRTITDPSKRYPVLVVLEKFSYDLYASIKRAGDVAIGIPTICVRRNTIDDAARGDLQKLSNIALKYNMKLRGDNHYLAGSTLQPLRSGQVANTIVIGADVTHPGNTSRLGTPSIAAVVGSIDDNFVKFPGSMRLQQSKKEDIVDLAQMVKERLLAWAYRHNRQLPQNVLFYRDGVSESQYDIVRRRELPQIQTAMNLAYLELEEERSQDTNNNNSQGDDTHPPGVPQDLPKIGDKKMSKAEKLREEKRQEEDQASQLESHPNNVTLNLTFIIVGKRHNTRFYPVRISDPITPPNSNGPKPNANVRPGLVVDQVITHPYSIDFYLQSHHPIQGTGRSAHYIVLRNNMGLSVDELQTITHTFCYAYARATKGVSYCTPAYYADRLCDRGRAYLRHLLVNKTVPAGLPNKQNSPSWEAYKIAMKNCLHVHPYYRPRPAGGENPWHPFMNDMMFYL